MVAVVFCCFFLARSFLGVFAFSIFLQDRMYRSGQLRELQSSSTTTPSTRQKEQQFEQEERAKEQRQQREQQQQEQQQRRDRLNGGRQREGSGEVLNTGNSDDQDTDKNDDTDKSDDNDNDLKDDTTGTTRREEQARLERAALHDIASFERAEGDPTEGLQWS